MKAKFFLIMAILFGIAINTDAQARRVEKREVHRIRQGVQNGQITASEAARLKRDERRINHDIKQAKADGTLTPAERRRIKKELERQNRLIRRARHN